MNTDKKNIQRDFLLAIGAFVIAFALWQFRPLSPVVYPLRLFVTFIHELGHGTAAEITGGDFLRFQVESTGAGLAYSSGGIRPIVISAGYVGTAIFGAVLLFVANRVHRPERVALVLGIAFIALTIFYSGFGPGNLNLLTGVLAVGAIGAAGYGFMKAKTDQHRLYALVGLAAGILLTIYLAAGNNRYTVIIGILSGVVLIVIGYYGTRDLVLFTMNFLAFVVGLNAISDGWVLLQIVSKPDLVLRNDAVSMADATPLPAIFWAVVWILLAVVLLGGATWFTFIRPLRIAKSSGSDL
ncbi:MAG TPA: M50 family metallopeptidase [Aggregatilineales bacterium]|nr:M50 family metallopeptidase [Aggregatilineales bacterium]